MVIRDRAWRRKKTEAKWISRCKRFIFDSIITDGTKVHSYIDMNGNKKTILVTKWRRPLDWKDMKKNDPWAKYLRDSSTSRSYVSDQMDAKREIKLIRAEGKKVIDEGLQEWEDLYDESLECWYDDETDEWKKMYQIA